MQKSEAGTSLEDVTRWIKQMGERGIYQPATARNRVTALERLSSVLAEDEPKDAQYLRENIEILCDRWTRKEGANPATANTYLSRSRVVLNDFFEYLRDPRGFKPKGRGPRVERSVRRPPKTQKTDNPPTVEGVGEGAGGEQMRSFPVAGSEFLYRLPQSLTVADVRRIAYHLVTFAEDFGETEMPSFGMVSRGDR